MTPQKAQIQALVNDIDRVLGKSSPRLPWVMTGEATQQRQVLEQTRSYLVSLQQQASATEDFEPDSTGSELVAYSTSQQPSGLSRDVQAGRGAAVESAQQVLQAVLEEMGYLRANVMQPLRSDLEEMNQRRDSLIQEIKQLEAERQQYALPQNQADQRLTTEFFQSLTARLREDLTGQVAQMAASLESQSPGRALRAVDADLGGGLDASQASLTPAQRLEQLQMIQAQSDQLILKLDTTLRVVFNSLQDSVKSYQESLGQGLERMHSLGQQGEAMFAALMNRLAEELGRGASSYLQSSVQTTDWEPRPTLQGGDKPPETPAAESQRGPQTTQPAAQSAKSELASEQVTDAEIDKLLSELNAIAPSTTSALPDVKDSVPPAATVAPVTDADLEDLDLLTFDLDDLPLEDFPESDMAADTEDITLFQISDEAVVPTLPEDEDITLLQSSEPLNLQSDLAIAPDQNPTSSPEPQIADLDSALDLLNQLSVELHEDSLQDDLELPPVTPESAIVPEPPDEPEALQFEQSETLQSERAAAVTPMNAAEPVASPENLYNELDDLYLSLFGATGTVAADQPALQPDLPARELAADLNIEPAATAPSGWEANIPGSLINEVSEDTQAIAPADDALLSSDLSDELFGGITDPGEGLGSSTQSEFLSDQAEDFLFDPSLESLPPDTSESASVTPDIPEADLLAAEIPPLTSDDSEDITAELVSSPQPQTVSPLEADLPEADTIANLSDLLEPDLLEPELPVSGLVQVEPETTVQPEPTRELSDDAYIPAAPDEDLLVPEELQLESSVDLQLDPDVLQQLTVDLSNLEGLQDDNLSSLADLETASPDWTLADWAEPEPTADAPPADALLEDVDLSLAPEPETEGVPETSIEAIALSDSDFSDLDFSDSDLSDSDFVDLGRSTTPEPSETASETIEDLFFPDTSDLSDLLSYQEALAAEVVDQEVSSFEDEELGTFADQNLGSFIDESGAEPPLLDRNTTLADLFDSDPIASDPDLLLEEDLVEEDLISDEFADFAPASPQRETTLEDLFAIAEVTPPVQPPSTLPPSASEEQSFESLQAPQNFEQPSEQPDLSPPTYDTTLEDLFAMPSDSPAQEQPLPEGEYIAVEESLAPFPSAAPNSSFLEEATLENLFDLPEPESSQSAVSDAELTLNDFAEDVSTSSAPFAEPISSDQLSLDQPDSLALDFSDFGSPEEPDVAEEPDGFTLEGLDSLFKEVAEEPPTSTTPTNFADEFSGFEALSDPETDSQDLTLDNAFTELEAPVEYGSATDLPSADSPPADFPPANSIEVEIPEQEYGSATDLFSFESDPIEPDPVEPDPVEPDPVEPDPVEPDPNIEYGSSTDLFSFEVETTDLEDPEKKTLDLDLTEAPDFSNSDAELAEFIPDLEAASEKTASGIGLELEAEGVPPGELGELSEFFAELKVESEADSLEEFESAPLGEFEFVPEGDLGEPAIAPGEMPETSLEPPLELSSETLEDGLAEDGLAEDGLAEDGLAEDGLAEDGLEDWSDRLPSDFAPSDFAPAELPDSELDNANPFPDISLLDPGFGLEGFESDFQETTPPLSGSPTEEPATRVWYLGIDFGTAGISAVLLNRSTCELYPIYWSEAHPQGEGDFVTDRSFRLPTVAFLSTGRDSSTDPNLASPERDRGSITSVAIGSLALDLNQRNRPGVANPSADSARLLHDFKPYLSVGIPHYSPQTSGWEPVLQWSDQHQLELSWLHQALQTLLATLSHHRLATPTHSALSCAAVGLDAATFQTALRQLAGVVMGYPSNGSDTYSFNIREAVLGARLVAHPEQIFFIEDAIATLLSGLRSADGRAIVLPNNLSQKPYLYNTDWQGSTLVISAGATVTEMAIVDLPGSLQNLSYPDFTLRNLPYAGNALDQDIICQLLYPTWSRQPRREAASDGYTFGSAQTAKTGVFIDGWHWQPTASDSETMTWASLELETLDLPSPGEPDPLKRHRLQQRLESLPMGQSLLEAARHLKLILQQQDRFNLELGDQQWTIMRRELGSRVLLPYIQRLNRELNALLTQTGVPIQSINQVVCTGGTASFGAIARWLRQKLPNATIIQDTYTNSRGSNQENRLPTCSRVAYGLATLPLHPQVLDQPRQQYSDYFLLMELLRAFPDQPLSLTNIMQTLERHGINTQACRLHILALLEGHLPPGLVPTEKDADLLAAKSKQNPDYQMLLAAPLFQKLDNQTYRPNPQQWNHFRSYLSTITASTHQKLSEPLTVGLGIPVQE